VEVDFAAAAHRRPDQAFAAHPRPEAIGGAAVVEAEVVIAETAADMAGAVAEREFSAMLR